MIRIFFNWLLDMCIEDLVQQREGDELADRFEKTQLYLEEKNTSDIRGRFLHIERHTKEAIDQYDIGDKVSAAVAGEEFIDAVVDRIRKKQLIKH